MTSVHIIDAKHSLLPFLSVSGGHGMADLAVKCILLAIFIKAIPFFLLLSINFL
jgi:hypothetical protein